jgi:RNA polymerase sigma-70 factor (ECF subfamily)
MEEFSDEELLRRYRASANSRAGDGLINQLFERHHSRVAAWCYRLTGDVETSADLAQEVFLKAFQRLDSFRGDSKFTTWLYTIARNHCMDQLRTRASAPQQNAELLADQMEDLRTEQISAVLERREAEELVRRLMRESLDETESKVMTLHYVHELPLESVTRLLRLTNASGAKAHIVSARRKLARAVDLWKKRKATGQGGNNAE